MQRILEAQHGIVNVEHPTEDDENVELEIYLSDFPASFDVRPATELHARIATLWEYLNKMIADKKIKGASFILFEIRQLEAILETYARLYFCERKIKEFLMKQYDKCRRDIVLIEKRESDLKKQYGNNAKEHIAYMQKGNNYKDRLRHAKMLKYLLSPQIISKLDSEVYLPSRCFTFKSVKFNQLSLT